MQTKYSNPSNLAVVACPGGEIFANEVVYHLKGLYRHIFDESVSEIAKRFEWEPEEVLKKLNFINETTTVGGAYRSKDLKLHIPHFKVATRFTMFANGEIKAEILESIREKELYIVQDVENHSLLSTYEGSPPRSLSVNDHIVTLFVTIDAARQAGAKNITLVLPIYPYSRQHKKKGREGITASQIGRIFESLGVDRIITLDIHSREIGNCFCNMRMENLHASYQIIRRLSALVPIDDDNLVVVSPDTGAVDRNKFYATALKKPLALLYKERDYSKVSRNALENNIKDIKLLGDVRDKTVFMADDILGTGGTLLKAMKFLQEQSAGKVICAVSLPLFSGDSISIFDEAYKQGLFFRIIGTNAVYQEELQKKEWYITVKITKLFARTISRLHQGISLSSILDNRDVIVKALLKSGDNTNEHNSSFLPFHE
jgi:ribose-phosphate pyrophosphokinase